ncbi:acyl carrier protein [Streptomyces sp. NPDC006339]|uniref:acyl carrier protein n=1 Tax=Streptomyces sp. NPDC006339 TaxID=3156755 RepID=UPI0033B96733
MSDTAATPSDAEIADRVRSAVRSVVGSELAPADDALELAPRFDAYDSLGVLDCVGAVEREFGIAVDLVDDDLRTTFVSVAAISALVRRKLDDQAVLGAAF